MPSPLRFAPTPVALALALLFAGCGGGGGGPSGCRVDADCSDGSACSTDTCDPATGRCSHAQAAATARFALFGAAASGQVLLPEQSGGVTGLTWTFCPGGAAPGASPPRCAAVLTPDGAAVLSRVTATTLNLQAGFATVLEDAPVDYLVASVPGSLSLVVSGNDSCPGGPATPSTGGRIDVDLTWPDPADGGLRLSTVHSLQPGLSGLHTCGPPLAGVVEAVTPLLVDSYTAEAIIHFVAQLEANLCRAPPCPAGTTDDGGVCRSPGGSCAPRLGPTGLLEPRGCRP